MMCSICGERAFNSLSRDHLTLNPLRYGPSDYRFQLPLSGSRDHYYEGAVTVSEPDVWLSTPSLGITLFDPENMQYVPYAMAFQLPLSGSLSSAST